MRKILLTGSTGFIGKELCQSIIEQQEFELCKVVRNKNNNDSDSFIVGEFNSDTDFSSALEGVSVVIHLAAVAHSNYSSPSDAAKSYKSCNVDATLALAKQASEQGVCRFIFLSSIGVNGNSNSVPFTPLDLECPVDDYAKSKYEAETALRELSKLTRMEVVIIRPPLVYGKNAPGNFGILLKVAEKNLPLPLGSINNKRSFVAIDNLVDLIVACIDHPNAVNQTFLVSDDVVISTSDLLKKLTLAAGKKPWLFPVPVSYLMFVASIFGKKEAVEKFSSSLTIDIEYTKKTLNWKPPITLDEGIRRCFK
ncbi:NAD-dependent epimerase/dehydratase family protein [Pseudoalteromonas sp. 1_2015MBL_MicDiv]|uniref:NAD-dependent epimerase/dehydratase family protein n=1 Tax=Pseudoalteromonas sp. 1_2015MBL_MicDiv TaxID=1720343 RepID=UPI000BBE6F69|nr:NAD-dependent epimerase/dehydratase family protein [Pseudoalteromonas sp. 1_2015MBL_MicDiv]ATG76505.1 nucleoside-diphosphate sugar epimerase [Pseudoalteromonas sp. 1_2015MBL_MicDiv]